MIKVAIKVLESISAKNQQACSRFVREAQAGASLAHQNIACVREMNIDATIGLPFIVMDLVEGKSLAEVLEGGEPFSQARIIDIALQLSSGFRHAHQHGVLHRDIKPSNVMVSVDDKGLEVAKIVDFGIARLIDQDSHRLTHTGETVGTPYYMSPEQAMGQATDERSDIYSFACLLYEMIYRVPPFTGDNHLAVMTQHLMKEPSAAQREGIDRALVDTR